MGKALEKFAGIPKGMKALARKLEDTTVSSNKEKILLGGKNNAVVQATIKRNPSGAKKRIDTSNQLRKSYALNRVTAAEQKANSRGAAETAKRELSYGPEIHDFDSPIQSKITKKGLK